MSSFPVCVLFATTLVPSSIQIYSIWKIYKRLEMNFSWNDLDALPAIKIV
jgi:hypothetical protein